MLDMEGVTLASGIRDVRYKWLANIQNSLRRECISLIENIIGFSHWIPTVFKHACPRSAEWAVYSTLLWKPIFWFHSPNSVVLVLLSPLSSTTFRVGVIEGFIRFMPKKTTWLMVTLTNNHDLGLISSSFLKLLQQIRDKRLPCPRREGQNHYIRSISTMSVSSDF